MSERPHNPDCRCCECFGLAEYMLRLTGKDYGLPRTLTLRVLTTNPRPENLIMLPSDQPVCDDSLTCMCPRCVSERAARVRRGVRPSQDLPVKVRRAA